MLQELEQREFYLCKALIDKSVQLEARSIVYGTAPGRIFVDDAHSPKMGLIWLGNNDGFIFIGDETLPELDKRINRFIDEFISKEAKKVDVHYFEAIPCHERWNSVIERIFEHRGLDSWLQYVYRLDNTESLLKTAEADDTMYVPLQALLQYEVHSSPKIHNITTLEQSILQFWPSIALFLEHGIGYGAVLDQKLVSYCMSAFVLEDEHAVDIETLEPYRRQGHALALAELFAKACLIQDKVVYWDCMASNIGSVAIAEGIGCIRARDYTGYYFKL